MKAQCCKFSTFERQKSRSFSNTAPSVGQIPHLGVVLRCFNRRFSRSRDFLADRLTEPVRLADAAAEACLSKFHYLRLFRRAFPETPHDFVRRRRMEQARALLAARDLTVTEVCLEVGYSSLGSFSARFQQTFGVAPTEYRARARVAVPVNWPPTYLVIPSCFRLFYGIVR